MDSRRWVQIEELFHRLSECDPTQRARLLEESGDNDPELRQMVEALLASAEGAAHSLQDAVYGGLDAVAFPLVGEEISHYRILAGIGTGGMGSVYRAEDIKLGRQVAVKFLAQEFVEDSAALERFEREARSASALEHPGICPVYEFGEHGGQPFLVMPLLQGQTLRELLARRAPAPLDTPELLRLAVQISGALDAAHRHGIIHRDIKPANIFVTAQGEAKILDFGLAKSARGEIARNQTAVATGSVKEDIDNSRRALSAAEALLSRTGVALGTSAYMSPEQARGEKLDIRTDIFSFGLVLYEMATGQRAFQGASEPILHDVIFRQTPTPVRQINRAVPARLEAIITRALERNRDARYATATELLADLAAVQAATSRRSAPSRSQVVGAAVAVLVLATVVASMWAAWRHGPPPEARNAKLRQVTTNSWENPVTSGAISPDGRHLVYTDANGLHLKQVGSEESVLVPQPEAFGSAKIAWEIGTAAWTPDSQRYVATSHPASEDPSEWASTSSIIWSASVAGEAPHRLRDAARAWNVSPDGAWISFGTSKGRLGERELWIMNARGEQARNVVQVGVDRAVCCLSFFHNQDRFSYVMTDASGDVLVTQDVSGGPTATVMGQARMRDMGDLVWLPDGRLIHSDFCFLVRFDTPCSYWIERYDIHSGRLIEPARRLTTVVGASLGNTTATPDGRFLSFQRTAGNQTAYVADMETDGTSIRNLRHLTLDEGDDGITDWTPDGQTAIVVRNRAEYFTVYKQAVGSSAIQPIVARVPGALLEAALVSPDAKWLTLQVWPLPPPANLAPRKQIWRVSIDGGTVERLFSVAPGSAASCARAPATLCVIGEPTADRAQVTVSTFDPSTGQRGRELLRFDRYANPNEDMVPLAFALSPDGEWLSTSPSPAGPLRVLSLHGAPEREISLAGVRVGAGVSWTPDGKGLILTNHSAAGASLVHMDLQGNMQTLMQCESGRNCFGIPSPDGRYLGVDQTRVTSNIWSLEGF